MSLSSPSRILVATDFSESADAALDAALDLAQPSRAHLELVHVYPLPGVAVPFADTLVMASAETMAALQAKLTEALEVRAARVRARGLECVTHALPGAAAQEVVARAAADGADLIVIGTHGRSGLTHAVLGSVAERVVQHAACPVLVVPHRDARPRR
jgi:nucleotide-binding universal stress UspA family protein